MSAMKARQGNGKLTGVAAALFGTGLLGSLTACSALTGSSAAPVAATLSTSPSAAPHPAAAGAAGTAAAAAQSGVRWSQVGPGWLLATTTAGTHGSTLDLVSPAGATYPVYTWPASASVPNLLAWSPSKTEVLLTEMANGDPTGTYERLNLQTGQVTDTLSLPGEVGLQYTPPDGQQLLVTTTTVISPGNGSPDKNTVTYARYSLTGTLVQTLGSITVPLDEPEASTPVYSPNGATIAIGMPTGVALLSNAGGTITQLAQMPGIDTALGCTVDRWWNASTILAACGEAGGAHQLWLVPASGAAATALTPLRPAGGTDGDDGDWDAWQTASGLYLQSNTASGSLLLNKQAADGSVTPVTIPGMDYLQVQASDGSQLLLDARGSAANSSPSLIWYDPATGGTTAALKSGFSSQVLPFGNDQNS